MRMQSLRGQSLKGRMSLYTLTIFLVSMWALSCYARFTLRQDMEKISGAQQFATVFMLATQIDNALNERIQALTELANEVAPLIIFNGLGLHSHLQEHPLLNTIFNGGVFIVGMDGSVVVDLPRSSGRIGSNYLDRAWFSTALREGMTVVGQPEMGKIERAPVFVIATPIRDQSGKVLGVLVGSTDLSMPSFLDGVLNSTYGKSGGYLLVSRDSQLVVAATEKSRTLQPVGSAAMVSRYIEGHEGTDVHTNGHGVEMLVSVKGIPLAHWYLAAMLPTAEAFAPIDGMQQRLLWLTLVLSTLACISTWWMMRRQLSPLLATVDRLALLADESAPLVPLPLPQGSEIAALVTGVNRVFHTLKSREAALADRDTFRRSIIDSVPAHIAVLDRHGIIVVVNKPWLRFLQENRATSDDAAALHVGTGSQIGVNYLSALRNAIESTGDPYASKAVSGIQAVLDRALPVFEMEYPCDSPMEKRWFKLAATPLESNSGGAVVSHSDITARKQAEEKLRLSEQRFAAMQRGSNDGFWDMNLQTNQFYFSPRWWSMLGYANNELANDPDLWRKLIHPDALERTSQLFSASLASDRSTHLAELSLRHKDGHYVPVDSRSFIERDQDGTAIRVSGSNQDLTANREAEAALLAAKAEAEAANQAKSRFLAAVSHDLRQPLAALTIYVDILKRDSGVQDTSLVANIDACCTNLSGLLTDLLDVSKLDAGVIAGTVSDFAIDDFLRPLIAVHEAKASSKGLQLRLRPSPGVNGRTDPVLLSRIVGNLISNAVRFTHQGGVLVACRRRAGALSLEVWDTGIGIPADKTEHVFQEFSKASEGPGSAGSGLGLAIVKKMAALLALPLSLRTKVGRGSLFSIELPMGQAVALSESAPPLHESRPLRIGLVEDYAQVRDALVQMLDRAGYQVIAAGNGNELLTRLGQQAPDLVISDYRLLAGETGFDVVRAVRAVFGNTLPAFIITGDTDPNLIRRMAQHGIAIHYKPLRIDKLMHWIGEATKRGLPKR